MHFAGHRLELCFINKKLIMGPKSVYTWCKGVVMINVIVAGRMHIMGVELMIAMVVVMVLVMGLVMVVVMGWHLETTEKPTLRCILHDFGYNWKNWHTSLG